MGYFCQYPSASKPPFKVFTFYWIQHSITIMLCSNSIGGMVQLFKIISEKGSSFHLIIKKQPLVHCINNFYQYFMNGWRHWGTSVPCNNEPSPFGFEWNFSGNFFLLGEKGNNFFWKRSWDSTTWPKFAQIMPKIEFFRAKWLFYHVKLFWAFF